MAGTAEIMPGVRVPTLAHTVGRLWPRITRELRLRDHGLRLVQPDVRTFAPQPGGGSSLVIHGDARKTAAALAANSAVGAQDGEAWVSADVQLRRLAQCLAYYLRQ